MPPKVSHFLMTKFLSVQVPKFHLYKCLCCLRVSFKVFKCLNSVSVKIPKEKKFLVSYSAKVPIGSRLPKYQNPLW